MNVLLGWAGFPYFEKADGSPPIPPTPRGIALYEKYGLGRWPWFSRETLEEVLGTLDLLDHLPMNLLRMGRQDGPLQALDVGSKNWRYLGALRAWFDLHYPQASLCMTGVEIDALRLYSNLRSRQSYARFYCSKFSDSSHRFIYRRGDVCDWQDPVDWVTWFFPFVSESTHRAWGLPKKSFRPVEAFAAVEASLVPGGTLVLANQGEWEWKEAKKLITNLKLRSEQEIAGSLHASSYPIFLTVWTRDA